MIFVTVGTHEQPFNRLVKAVDDLKMNGKITDSVFIQTGYSTYIPKACEYKDFITMGQMNKYMEEADTIITHGGPSSFIMALQHNKAPIVVPRLSKFNEHVNDHQLTFCNELVTKEFPIRIVQNIDTLFDKIKCVSLLNNSEVSLNNKNFIKSFQSIVSSIL
ncbi:glycosyltransferase [Latilactobacillus sakei]|uniref:glycosyltransferase n=1 Tax=Latilactobacillus sakei TaxID=1599 RepID=UPI000DCADCB8|nr:glycosyltransferase [Latilactobacillus sakei]AWZ44727.1 multidrug MFS transporter [Latilactobacillus sakei]